MIIEIARKLPNHKPYNYAINTTDGEISPLGPLYALSEKELEILREWLKEMLETCKIR
jgi:hypothetical protein